MRFSIPTFLRRPWILHRVRQALLSGSPERALELLTDSSLALSREADDLRDRTLEVLCKQAAQRKKDGSESSMFRILELVATEDRDRADAWCKRITGPSVTESSMDAKRDAAAAAAAASTIGQNPPASQTVSEGDVPSRAAALVERLLTEVHGFVARASEPGDPTASMGFAASGSRVASQEGAESHADAPQDPPPTNGSRHEPKSAAPKVPAVEPRATLPQDERPPRDPDAPLRFHLAVDDAGEFLVICGERISVGHARGGRADLPFLADLESVHALFVRGESFHGGPIWCLESTGEAVLVNGAEPDAESTVLSDGDEIQLGQNLSMRYALPDSSSSTAVLFLQRGAESEGAARVLLMGAGRAGRIRIGSRTSRHVPVPDLDEDVTVELEDDVLTVETESKMRVFPEIAGESKSFEFVCPPAERLDFIVQVKRENKPPFAFSIRPVDVQENRGPGPGEPGGPA